MPTGESEFYGHYRIVRRDDGSLHELGRGNMGITYLAENTATMGRVTLKVISPYLLLDREEAVERFVREAKAAAKLDDPHIPKIHHLGSENGDYYFAMDFVDGRTIENIVKSDGPIPWPRALGLTSQVADAFVEMYEKGVIHRDIQPANIMVGSKGRAGDLVKLIDFGLVKSVHEGDGHLAARVYMYDPPGTFLYMSPEQCRNLVLDIRSDIYSLGVTLWYMLTGEPTFGGNSVYDIQNNHIKTPPPLESLPASVPGPVRGLLARMLAKDRDDRPLDPAALIEEIERCQTDPSPGDAGAGGSGGAADPSVPSPYTFTLADLLGRRKRLEWNEVEGLIEPLSAVARDLAADGSAVLAAFIPRHLRVVLPSIPQSSMSEEILKTGLGYDHPLRWPKYRLESTLPPERRRARFDGTNPPPGRRFRDAPHAVAAVVYELLAGTAPGSNPKPLANLPPAADEFLRNNGLYRTNAETTTGKPPVDGNAGRPPKPPGPPGPDDIPVRNKPDAGGSGASMVRRLAALVALVMLAAGGWIAFKMGWIERLVSRDGPPQSAAATPVESGPGRRPPLAVDPDSPTTTPVPDSVRHGDTTARVSSPTPVAPDTSNQQTRFGTPLPVETVAPSDRSKIALASPPATPSPPFEAVIPGYDKTPASSPSPFFTPPITPPPRRVPNPTPPPVATPEATPAPAATPIPTPEPTPEKDLSPMPSPTPMTAEVQPQSSSSPPSMAAVEPVPTPEPSVAETAAPSPGPTPTPTPVPPDPAEKFLEAGRRASASADFPAAVTAYTKVLELKPDSLEALDERGTAYDYLRQSDKAMADYHKAVLLEPKDAREHFHRGDAFDSKNEAGDDKKAKDDYRIALKLECVTARDFYQRGLAHYHLGEKEAALTDLNQAIHLDPKHAFAYFRLGTIHMSKIHSRKGHTIEGERDKAINEFNKAIQLSPNFARALENRSNEYFAKEDYSNALKDFDKLIKAIPESATIYQRRGNIHLALQRRAVDAGDSETAQKQSAMAITDYKKSISLDSSKANAASYYGIGGVYMIRKDYQQAIANYDEAIRRDPDNAGFHNDRGDAYASNASNSNVYKLLAAYDFEEASKLDPDSTVCLLNLAQMCHALKQEQKAINACTRALKIDPKNRRAYEIRSAAYRALGRTEEAAQDSLKASGVTNH